MTAADRRARVLTVSTRAATGVYSDEAGPVAADLLTAMGLRVESVVVVPDGLAVAEGLAEAVDSQIDLLVTCGGTGISPTDRTADQTAAMLDFQVPGISEYIRSESVAKTPTAVLSRGVAGVAGRTLIINLPGSKKAVAECLELLSNVIPHALSQLAGGDHER